MKSLIVPLLATASFSTFLICGMVAASSLNLGYKPHKFANINNSIWTSTPVRVDRPADAVAFKSDRVTASSRTAVAANDLNETDAQQVAINSTSDGIAACQARYRSYRVSDNTYQPLDGGPRQPCAAATQSGDTAMTISRETSSSVAQNVDQSHSEWCQTRYSSYRASDDTYQPFGSADRRRCMSPVSMASNG